MNHDEFDALMATVTAVWTNWTANTLTFSVAERLLLDLDHVAALAAVDRLAITDPRWFPGIGALRAEAVELTDPQGQAPTMEEAWGEVRRAIARFGVHVGTEQSDRTLEWSHPAIGQVVEHMGWRTLCTSDNEVADRAHFARMYEARVDHWRVETAMPPSVRALLEQRHLAIPAGDNVRPVLADVPRRVLDVEGL